jgi:hypothetical protein
MALRAKGAEPPLAGLALGVAALLLLRARDRMEIRVVGYSETLA